MKSAVSIDIQKSRIKIKVKYQTAKVSKERGKNDLQTSLTFSLLSERLREDLLDHNPD